MPAPTAILVDTSIFDQHSYHFASPTFQAFVQAVRRREVELVLPDAIEREVMRHIKRKSHDAFKALEDARRIAPFVAKWKHWPTVRITDDTKREIEKIAEAEWLEFLRNFTVVRLGYAGLDLVQIMDWYDAGKAPFGKAGKRKEFPDAFCIAAALSYAKETNQVIAIVSFDNDHDNACQLHSGSLRYFRSLSAVTEAFLADEAELERTKAAILSDTNLLEERIADRFLDSGFYPASDPYGDVSGVEVENIELPELHILEITGHTCHVSFTAVATFSAYLRYPDPHSAVIDSSEGIYAPVHWRGGRVRDEASVEGTAALQLDAEHKKTEGASDVYIENNDIAVSGEPGLEPDYDPTDA